METPQSWSTGVRTWVWGMLLSGHARMGRIWKKKWQITLKMYYIYLLYACVVLVGQAWSSRHIEVKGQPTGVGFLLLPCGSQGFISCCQGKGHGPLLTEPSGLSAKSFNGSHHLTDGSLESNCPPWYVGPEAIFLSLVAVFNNSISRHSISHRCYTLYPKESVIGLWPHSREIGTS